MSSNRHSWLFYFSPHDAWEAMYQDCLRATKSIQMEQYIFQNDSVGQRFMELFIEKAALGVKVLIICDAYGSSSFLGSPLIDKLRKNNGHFYFYNIIHRWDLLRPWRWFPRTHIKSLLIDSEIAYTGSACFAEHMERWRDTQIRITGPVVEQFSQAFERAEKFLLAQKPHRRPRINKKEFGEFTYLQSYPLLSWNIIYAELIAAIQDAKHYIYITTPFFAPNRRFRNLLQKAAHGGVEVKLLVPLHSDIAIADWVFISYTKKLLEAGCRIFFYNKMLHSKTVVIDDKWATIGSTNMDVLSFFRNRESNLIFKNSSAIAELKQHFLTDLEQSHELTLQNLSHVPAYIFALGYLGRMFKSFLWKK